MDITQFPSWIITGIFGVIGVAVGWGYFKAEIKNQKDKSDKLEEQVNTLILSRPTLELRVDCDKNREKCQNEMKDKLADIKNAINSNREIVLEKFDEIKEFMGYVKGKIEDYNGRLK